MRCICLNKMVPLTWLPPSKFARASVWWVRPDPPTHYTSYNSPSVSPDQIHYLRSEAVPPFLCFNRLSLPLPLAAGMRASMWDPPLPSLLGIFTLWPFSSSSSFLSDPSSWLQTCLLHGGVLTVQTLLPNHSVVGDHIVTDPAVFGLIKYSLVKFVFLLSASLPFDDVCLNRAR